MSFRFDTPLIASAYHFGNRGLGVLGSAIPSTGTNGPSYMYNDLSLPADANKEYSGFVVTPPGIGTFFAYEDGSFTYTGASTSFVYKLREDGVDKGNQTVTITMSSNPAATVGWTEADDTSAIAASVTATTRTATVSWTEANDTSSLSGNVASVSDTTNPTMNGALTITAITTGGFTATWTSGSDNVGVLGYEISIDTGTPSYTQLGSTLTYTATGKAAGTDYTVRVRDYDAAGNRSTPLTTTVNTTAAGALATSVTLTFNDRNGTPRANLTGMKWAFFDQTTPNNLGMPSAKGISASTNSAGVTVVNITGTGLAPGAIGWLIFSNSDGTATQSNLISFAGPVITA